MKIGLIYDQSKEWVKKDWQMALLLTVVLPALPILLSMVSTFPIIGWLIALAIPMVSLILQFVVPGAVYLQMRHEQKDLPVAIWDVTFEDAKVYWWRYLKAGLYQLFTILFYSLFLVVPGIIKSISYALVPYIFQKNKKAGVVDIFRLSSELMDGYKMSYVKMYFRIYRVAYAIATVLLMLSFFFIAWLYSSPGQIAGYILIGVFMMNPLLYLPTIAYWNYLKMYWQSSRVLFLQQLINE